MSTVGTASEVYHHLRLLWSRLGVVHCVRCGEAGQVVDAGSLAARLAADFPDGVDVLAPLVRRRQGDPLDVIAPAPKRRGAAGRSDGALVGAAPPPRIDRYQIHDVEAVVERFAARAPSPERLQAAVAKALDLGAGTLVVSAGGDDRLYSTRHACPSCGT